MVMCVFHYYHEVLTMQPPNVPYCEGLKQHWVKSDMDSRYDQQHTQRVYVWIYISCKHARQLRVFQTSAGAATEGLLQQNLVRQTRAVHVCFKGDDSSWRAKPRAAWSHAAEVLSLTAKIRKEGCIVSTITGLESAVMKLIGSLLWLTVFLSLPRGKKNLL